MLHAIIFLIGLVSDFPHRHTLLEAFTFDLLCAFALKPPAGLEPATFRMEIGCSANWTKTAQNPLVVTLLR